MQAKIWVLLKGFVPVFRFFEAGQLLPVLELRTENSESSWRPLVTKSKIKLFSLFHNPELNLNLYLYSMVHELTQDHIDQKQNSFAERKLIQVLRFRYPRFQYRLRNSLTDEVVFTSGWFDAEPS